MKVFKFALSLAVTIAATASFAGVNKCPDRLKRLRSERTADPGVGARFIESGKIADNGGDHDTLGGGRRSSSEGPYYYDTGSGSGSDSSGGGMYSSP